MKRKNNVRIIDRKVIETESGQKISVTTVESTPQNRSRNKIVKSFIYAWNNFTSKNEPRFYQIGSAIIYFMTFLIALYMDFAAKHGKVNVDITTPIVVGIIFLTFSIGSFCNFTKNKVKD